jgi:23S rRNA (cytosine1962-C5)-methyltransferase
MSKGCGSLPIQPVKLEFNVRPQRAKNKKNKSQRGLNQRAESAGQDTGFRPKPKHAAKPAAPSKNSNQVENRAPVVRPRKTAQRPSEKLPVILETLADQNYALLDTGDGLKLEHYGDIKIIRPEQQAIWGRSQDDALWDSANAIFTGDTDEEGVGRWRFPGAQFGETWPMAFDGVGYMGRFTSFRHVGVFPEQAAHWRAMREAIKSADRPLRVLNLFGYTGVASLVAADAGAHVTHVDASKKAIGWARENQSFAGLDEMPVRWICEDAMKFVQREIRRGNTYDIILLDPPAYGRGPNGEVWQLFDHLPDMLDGCRDLLSDNPVMLILTAYAIRASFFAMHEAMMDSFTGYKTRGCVESGELIIREKLRGRALSTSMFSRWLPESANA